MNAKLGKVVHERHGRARALPRAMGVRLRCGVTGKVAFRTAQGALNRGMEILNGEPVDMRQVRAYQCEYCGRWHLTKK